MERKDNLSRLREQKGLTQQELAEELGVSRQAVSQWESGRTFPSMEKQLALSRLYGVSPEALYWEDTARGHLTNSRAHARNYLIVGAVVSAGGSFAYFLYSLLKKIKEEKK